MHPTLSELIAKYFRDHGLPEAKAEEYTKNAMAYITDEIGRNMAAEINRKTTAGAEINVHIPPAEKVIMTGGRTHGMSDDEYIDFRIKRGMLTDAKQAKKYLHVWFDGMFRGVGGRGNADDHIVMKLMDDVEKIGKLITVIERHKK